MNKVGLIVATLLVTVFIIVFFTFTGCNMQLVDTTWDFNYAYVVWPDGTTEKLVIKSWTDFEDGDQIQIKTDRGSYVFHSSNCVLASE